MPRILTIIDQYLPYLGGAENVARQIVENTNSGKYSNDVLTVAYHHIEEKFGVTLEKEETIYLENANYKIFRVRPLRIFAKQFNIGFLRNYLLLNMVRKIIRLSRHYDLVHAHTYHWPAYAALIAKKYCSIPVVITGHSMLDRFVREVDAGTYPQNMLNILKTTNAYVAISERINDQAVKLAGINKRKVIKIDNSVDTARFAKVSDQNTRVSIKDKYAIKPEDIVISYHGRLEKNKDIATLIRALAKVKDKNIAFKLIIHGQGDQYEYLSELVNSLNLSAMIDIRGYVNDVEDILGVSDIYVLPSHIEGLPLALLEAMACGNICIATDIPGTNEVITNEKTGLLFTPSDVNDLAEKIIYVCDCLKNNPAYINKLKMNCKLLIETRFTLNSMINNYTELFDDVIAMSGTIRD